MTQIENTRSGERLMGSDNIGVNCAMFEALIPAYLPPSKRNEEKCYVAKDLFLEMKPENPVEGMILSQLVVMHSHAMALMAESHKVASLEMKTQYFNAATKLLRAFNDSIDTLNKNRRGGRQMIRVDHVHVNDGGQAIVGVIEDSKKGGV